MNTSHNLSRRRLLKMLAGSALLTTALTNSGAAEVSLLSEDDPAAKAVHYVTDVSRAKDAKPGSTCATCSLYSGDSKSDHGACALFGNKQVKANGWCSSWTDM